MAHMVFTGTYDTDKFVCMNMAKINPCVVTFSMSCTKATIKRCKIVVTKIQASCYKFMNLLKIKKNQFKWLPR